MAKTPPNKKDIDDINAGWKTMRNLMAEANKHGDKAIQNAKEIKKQQIDNVKYMAQQGQEAKEFGVKLGMNLALSEQLQTSAHKNTEENKRNKEIYDSTVSTLKEVVAKHKQNNDFMKKSIPFAGKISDMESERNAILKGTIKLTGVDKKNRLKALNDGIKLTKNASMAMQVEERRGKILEKGLGPIMKAREGVENMMLSARAMLTPMGAIAGIFMAIGAAVKLVLAPFRIAFAATGKSLRSWVPGCRSRR